MTYLGSWKVDDLLTFPANTHRFDTGAGTDADSPATYRIYEDETGTPILTGSMALLDSANTVGFYSEQITLSAANGFEKGKCYTIYITATVNSVAGTMSHTFQIEAEVDANIVSDKTGYGLAAGAITASVIATDAIDNDAIAANAVTEIQSGLSTLTQADIRTAVGLGLANLDTQLSTIAGYIDTEIGTLLTNVATILAAVDTEVAAIKAKTDNLPSDPADASDIASSFSTVNSTLATIAGYIDTEVATILAAVDTEVGAIKAKTDNLPSDPADASDIATSFSSIATTLATIAGYIDAEVAIIKGVTDKLDTTLEVDGPVYRFTTNALEQAPAGGGGGGTGLINFVYGGEWVLNQQNRIDFYLQDAAGLAVTGLGSGYTLTLAKNGAAFAASAGTKAEIGSGWYTYLATAGEANTIGTIAVQVVGAGAVEQPLEYVVKQRTAGAIAFTYTLTTSIVIGLPIEGASVWITTDFAGANTIWFGVTDAFGVARDSAGGLPYLDPGTYYFNRQHPLFTFTNPDVEIVSNP